MNSKWHLYTSLIKSVIRIAGCVLSIILKDWRLLAVGLGVAEVLGIVEELGDQR